MSDFQTDALNNTPGNTFGETGKTRETPERSQDHIPDSLTSPRSTSLPTAPATTRRVPSLTNSPGCSPVPVLPSIHLSPAKAAGLRPLRRVRTVRTDAWATPASVSWTRTRKTVRKVSRQSQSTNWALPF